MQKKVACNEKMFKKDIQLYLKIITSILFSQVILSTWTLLQMPVKFFLN